MKMNAFGRKGVFSYFLVEGVEVGLGEDGQRLYVRVYVYRVWIRFSCYLELNLFLLKS